MSLFLGVESPFKIFLNRDQKKSRLSLAGRKENKVGLSTVDIAQSSQPMERRWSFVLSRKKSVDKLHAENKILVPCGLSPVLSMPSLTPDKRASLMHDNEPEFLQAMKDEEDEAQRKKQEDLHSTSSEYEKMSVSDEDFVKVPRVEYEAMKDRVAAIETCISQEFQKNEKLLNDSFVEPIVRPESGPVAVDDKYHATLKETHPINEVATTTDQLAKRLSRELKIRRSTEHQVIRSPSARKIGTMRRRSRESARLSRNATWHVGSCKDLTTKINDMSKESLCLRSNLKRGRPNTYLRHPSPVKKTEKVESTEDKSINGSEQWHDAKSFFSDPVNDPHNMSVDLIEDQAPPIHVTLTPEIQITKPELSLFKTPCNLPPRMTTALSSATKSSDDKTPMLPPSLPPRRSSTKSKTPRTLMPHHHTPIQQLQTGRASIARIRANVGHVAAKAKLFDNMGGESNSGGEAPKPVSRATAAVNRRQSIKPSSQQLLSVPETNRILKENNPPTVTTQKETTTPKRKNLKLNTEAARRYRLQMGVVRSPISANKQRKLDQLNAIKLQNRLEEIRNSNKHRLSDLEDVCHRTKTSKTDNRTPTKRSSRSGTPKKGKTPVRPSTLARKSPRTTIVRR